MLTLAELAAMIPGASVQGAASAEVTRVERVSTDTRTLQAGNLFVALRGPNFDGHNFVAAAAERGAAALLVEYAVDSALPQLIVPDSRRALGIAAAGWRKRFSLPVIAVAGSNGKTTVTQMIAAILARAYSESQRLATRGNLNNDIGVPLMLFELNAAHQAAVLELGMNHPGEIAYLAELVQPAVALVNNAQREHQEFMASVEATAHENGAVINALAPDGVAVFPADDACATIWRTLAGTRRVLDFARAGSAAVTAQYQLAADGTDMQIATPNGVIKTRLQVSGEHNVHNALAATAAALALGIAPRLIGAALAEFAPVAGRGVRHVLPNGVVLIDDTYNANPDSVRAAIDVLAAGAAPRVLVLGDMGEVGNQGPQFHREVGDYARSRGIEQLLALGDATRGSVNAFNQQAGNGGRHFTTIDALIDALKKLERGTALVKGSRFMRMERAVRALTTKPESAPAAQGTH